MTTKVSEFKGHPTIEFHESADCSDKYPVTMGVRKLRTILANLEAAKAFLKENSEKGVKQTDAVSLLI